MTDVMPVCTHFNNYGCGGELPCSYCHDCGHHLNEHQPEAAGTEGDAIARVKAVYPDADWYEESKWWAAGVWRKTHTGPMKIGDGNNEAEAWKDAASKLPQPERPEPAELPDEDCDEHDCRKCGKSVSVPDGYEFDGNSGDMCWSCLAAELEALKQSHKALVNATEEAIAIFGDVRSSDIDSFSLQPLRAALAAAKKLAEATR